MSDLASHFESLPDYKSVRRRGSGRFIDDYLEPARVLFRKGYPLFRIAEEIGRHERMSEEKRKRLYGTIRNWRFRKLLLTPEEEAAREEVEA